MNRDDKLFTQSISTACISANNAGFQYLDLRTAATSCSFINFLKVIPVNG